MIFICLNISYILTQPQPQPPPFPSSLQKGMAQRLPPPPPPPPLKAVHETPPPHDCCFLVCNTTHEGILAIVSNAWKGEGRWVASRVSNALQTIGISKDDADNYATAFVTRLEEVNGIRPTFTKEEGQKVASQVSNALQTIGISEDDADNHATAFVTKLEEVNGIHPTFTEVKAFTIDLISSFQSEFQKVLLEPKNFDMCATFARNFMRVCVTPVDVVIDGESQQWDCEIEMNHGTDYETTRKYSSTTTFVVSSPLFITDLYTTRVVCNKGLMNHFRKKIIGYSGRFYDECDTTAQWKYIKKAYHVLVHLMFDKSGLIVAKLTPELIVAKLTPEQIRSKYLSNICHRHLKDFEVIDKVLANIVSFLSNSYIQM